MARATVDEQEYWWATGDQRLEGLVKRREQSRTALRDEMGAPNVDLSSHPTARCSTRSSATYSPMPFFTSTLISCYRFSPSVRRDSCLFEILMLEPLPGVTHGPTEPMRLSVEQSYTEVDELAWLGTVYDQDTGNLHQQQGLSDPQGHYAWKLSEADPAPPH